MRRTSKFELVQPQRVNTYECDIIFVVDEYLNYTLIKTDSEDFHDWGIFDGLDVKDNVINFEKLPTTIGCYKATLEIKFVRDLQTGDMDLFNRIVCYKATNELIITPTQS